MKKLFTIIIAVIITASMFAQAPEKISYQAVIRNSSNELIKNQIIGMKISILKGSATGSAVYVEIQTPTTNINGLVTLEIGGGTVVTGNFANIDWANGPYYIKTEIDPVGGKNYTIIVTSQLLSVPFALYAKIAESAKGINNETDPFFNASIAKSITASDTAFWNSKSNFNGNYNSLENKPFIPRKTSELINDAGYITQFPDSIVLMSPGGKKFKLTITDEGTIATSEIIQQSKTITDIDGNVYNTIVIGTQTWMKENLKVTHFRNGDEILEILDSAQWANQTWNIGLSTILTSDPSYVSTYGRLYNWNVVIDYRNVCPVGWHVPSKDEWTTLIDFLGGNNQGTVDKLKEAGTIHWLDPNTGNNESGFTALPGGRFPIYPQYQFLWINASGSWWSTTAIDDSTAWGYSIIVNFDHVSEWQDSKDQGFSIRCVKDN